MTDNKIDVILLNLDRLPNDYWRNEIRQLVDDYRERHDHIESLEKEGRRYRESITKYRSAIWRLVELIEDGDLEPEDFAKDKALVEEAERAKKIYREGA